MGKARMSIRVTCWTQVVCDGSSSGPCRHNAAADYEYPSMALVRSAAGRTGWLIDDVAVCPACRKLTAPAGPGRPLPRTRRRLAM